MKTILAVICFILPCKYWYLRVITSTKTFKFLNFVWKCKFLLEEEEEEDVIAVGRKMVVDLMTELDAGMYAAEKKEVLNFCFCLNIEEILII